MFLYFKIQTLCGCVLFYSMSFNIIFVMVFFWLSQPELSRDLLKYLCDYLEHVVESLNWPILYLLVVPQEWRGRPVQPGEGGGGLRLLLFYCCCRQLHVVAQHWRTDVAGKPHSSRLTELSWRACSHDSWSDEVPLRPAMLVSMLHCPFFRALCRTSPPHHTQQRGCLPVVQAWPNSWQL
jgi:hypothetical protein